MDFFLMTSVMQSTRNSSSNIAKLRVNRWTRKKTTVGEDVEKLEYLCTTGGSTEFLNKQTNKKPVVKVLGKSHPIHVAKNETACSEENTRYGPTTI